ncbi:MAG: ribonuclease HII [Lachnospiraceae bacterium]|nr:ribonuclease HII [Lachnospiraceae bacterium]
MATSISEIKKQFEAANIEMLPQLIKEYEEDSRAGVQNLIKKANKRIADLEAEKKRIAGLWIYEDKYSEFSCICGIDEAGRGPLAGPVVAGAVVLPRDTDLLYINDSKKLSEKKREELYDIIYEKAISAAVGIVDAQRIDEINILQATYEAMRQAIGKLAVVPDLLLNDAVTIPEVPMRQVPIIKGDAKSISIGAASIIAKVTRDRIMVDYDKEYPEYGFAGHKGYGAAAHIAAIEKYGPCPLHRRSFIKNFHIPHESSWKYR